MIATQSHSPRSTVNRPNHARKVAPMTASLGGVRIMWRATTYILAFTAIVVVAACGQRDPSTNPLAPTSLGSTTTGEPTTTTAGTATTGTTNAQTTIVPTKTTASSNPCSSLTIKPVTQIVPACGTPMTAIVLTVTANSACVWGNYYRVNSSQPSWIYPVPTWGGAGNGTLRLSLNANYTGATRTGSITLLAAGVTATLTQPKCR